MLNVNVPKRHHKVTHSYQQISCGLQSVKQNHSMENDNIKIGVQSDSFATTLPKRIYTQERLNST